ncbi:universal stress protein [Variovorax rhizosphaerae]|uniref:Universal stress protein n=1 Tax=Variovorax rhizosphaerae TaxID=1836200 RepID=A0ABU8WNS7_9BURK
MEAAHAPVARAASAPALQNVLLASDGSEGALQAVQRLIALRGDLREGAALNVHLLNVQRPVSGDVSRFVASGTLEDYHRERSEKALVPARALLDAAGIKYTDHRRVGDPGSVIAELARAEACDLILMGARGIGTNTGALLGSVARSTVELSAVPVMLVK